MTGVGVSWSAPVWVGLSDRDYSELIQRKAVAVNKRDKRRGGQYTVKQAIEAIDEAFHRCSGFDPYDGSKLDPELLGTYSNERSKERGAAYKREMAMLPTVDHVKQNRYPTLKSSAGRPMTPRGICPLRSSSLTAAELFGSQISKDQIDVDQFLLWSRPDRCLQVGQICAPFCAHSLY